MGEIRFVGTGETRGYPYLVCKKYMYFTWISLGEWYSHDSKANAFMTS